MESMRDINRVMEREIAKGSCPLKLDHIEFGDYSYQEITSKELNIGDIRDISKVFKTSKILNAEVVKIK